MSSKNEEQQNAKDASKITPGDNPNKNKATGKSKYKPKKKMYPVRNIHLSNMLTQISMLIC